jgi:hypothetical protein
MYQIVYIEKYKKRHKKELPVAQFGIYGRTWTHRFVCPCPGPSFWGGSVVPRGLLLQKRTKMYRLSFSIANMVISMKRLFLLTIWIEGMITLSYNFLGVYPFFEAAIQQKFCYITFN